MVLCPSVYLSFPSSHHCSSVEWVCCWPLGRQQWCRHSMAHSTMALGSKCKQCHVYCRRRKLNTDLFDMDHVSVVLKQLRRHKVSRSLCLSCKTGRICPQLVFGSFFPNGEYCHLQRAGVILAWLFKPKKNYQNVINSRSLNFGVILYETGIPSTSG